MYVLFATGNHGKHGQLKCNLDLSVSNKAIGTRRKIMAEYALHGQLHSTT